MLRQKKHFAVIVFFIVCLAIVRAVYNKALEQELEVISQTLESELGRIVLNFNEQASDKLHALQRFSKNWALLKKKTHKEWQSRAALLVKHYPNTFQAIEYADLDFKISRIEPLEGNQVVLGLDIRDRPFSEEQLREIGLSEVPRYTPPFSLKQETRGIILYVPVFHKGEFDGYHIAVFHLEKYLKQILHSYEENYQLQVRIGDLVEYQSSGLASADSNIYRVARRFQAFDTGLELVIYPNAQQIELLRNDLAHSVPVAGGLISALASLILWLFLHSREKAQALEIKSRQLANQVSAAEKLTRDLEISKGVAEDNEVHLKTIFEGAPSGALIVDANGIIVSANRAVEQIFNYSKEELVGQAVELLVPLRFREQHPVNRALFMEQPTSRLMGEGRNLSGLKKNGSEAPIEVSLSSILSVRGSFAFASIVDISERIETEQRLKSINEELRRSNEALDEFAYIASHDLKAPLRAIENYAKWVAEDLADNIPEESREHLHKMRARVQAMELLLDDLLAYARVDQHQKKSTAIDTHSLVQSVFSLLEPPAGFNLVIEGELPVIIAQKERLEIVFRNLIGNAIKHHHKKDGVVKVSGGDKGNYCEFSVSDDGPGVAAQYHQKIFDMFQTLKPRDECNGTGIGLALVKKIVESSGGNISIISEVDQGATLHFIWPKEEN